MILFDTRNKHLFIDTKGLIMTKVLIPVTNHATLGDTDSVNGTYAPELTHVLQVLMDANIDYDIASIQGGKAPIYGQDMEGDDINAAVLGNEDFLNQINNHLLS